jgi:hypothetical protein
MSGGRTPYSRALAAFDHAAILASLNDDVTIRVAVHDDPLKATGASFCSRRQFTASRHTG